MNQCESRNANCGKNRSKFAADRMLGRLVKWLRILGQDVIYGPHLTGYGLIRAARAEEPPDTHPRPQLETKAAAAIYHSLQSDDYREQLRQVVRDVELEFGARHVYPLFEVQCRAPSQAQRDFGEGRAALCLFDARKIFLVSVLPPASTGPATHQQKMLEELGNMARR